MIERPLEWWRVSLPVITSVGIGILASNSRRRRMSDISDIVGPNRPIETNANGGSQSSIPVRFDLIDGPALFNMAKVLKDGADNYGENNWRKISIEDHLNHLIMHAYAYLAGDKSDEHLSHIMCRAMFAQAVQITEG